MGTNYNIAETAFVYIAEVVGRREWCSISRAQRTQDAELALEFAAKRTRVEAWTLRDANPAAQSAGVIQRVIDE